MNIFRAISGVFQPLDKPVVLETGRFDTNSSSEIAKKLSITSSKVCNSKNSKKNVLGEYSSIYKPITGNHLHLKGINLYQNDRR